MRLPADGAPLDERQVDIPARTRTHLSIPLPVDAHHITVRLLGHDSLALDDVAETNAPGGPPRDVALIGRVTDGLRRALESIPTLQVRPLDASVLRFAPWLSGLEKSLAFPLLISNATSFLLNQPAATSASIAEPFDPTKSDIAPRPAPTFSSPSPTAAGTEGMGERWQWLLAAALVGLGLEWLVFARAG